MAISANIPLYEGGKLFAERKEARAAQRKIWHAEQIEKGLQRTLYLADYALDSVYSRLRSRIRR